MEKCSSTSHILNDVSVGGFAFHTKSAINSGSAITINIPHLPEGALTNGYVVWCKGKPGDYIVGVRFTDDESAFRARMVQQICHIEQYRRKIASEEGRQLSSEQAANEWISLFAADFP